MRLSESPSANTLRLGQNASVLVCGYSTGDAELTAWEVPTGRLLYKSFYHSCFDISADERLLAVARRDGSVAIIDLRNPPESARMAGGGADATESPSEPAIRHKELAYRPESLAFSPDGRRLAVCYADRRTG